MNEKKSSQIVVIAVMGIITLLGVGMLAFFIGQLLAPTRPSETATATPTITPLPPPIVTIAKIQGQADLSTVEMSTVTEVYNETMPEGWLDATLGNKEELLMLVYGDVRAGFNLEQLKAENLWVEGQKVRLILPSPQILNSSLDFDRSRIIYYDNSLVLDNSNPNLQGEALERAKAAIEQAALVDGILDQANTFGQLYFENFLYSLGFTEVEVILDAQIETTKEE